MRFRRVLLTLAPLIGLAAIVNTAPAGPQTAPSQNHFIRLLQSVVHLAAADEEAISAPRISNRSLHAVLDLTALFSTPHAHSVWLVASSFTTPPPARPPLRTLLRC